jgi:hypothetical protein
MADNEFKRQDIPSNIGKECIKIILKEISTYRFNSRLPACFLMLNNINDPEVPV